MVFSSFSPLAASTGYRLVKLGHMAHERAEEALSGVGVKPRHLNVLMTVAENPELSQREISNALGLDPNIMVGVIDELEGKGLALRERSAVDRRRHVVVVTERGRDVLERGAAALRESEEEFFAALSRSEREVLGQVVSKLLGAPDSKAG